MIDAILSSKDEGDTIDSLFGDDAQASVDVIDEACSTFTHHRESTEQPKLISTLGAGYTG